MQPLDTQFASSIDNVSRALAEWTVQEMFERKPEFERLYPADGRALWVSLSARQRTCFGAAPPGGPQG